MKGERQIEGASRALQSIGGMTPRSSGRSRFVHPAGCLVICSAISFGCGGWSEVDTRLAPPEAPAAAPAAPKPAASAPVPSETSLGVADKGLWSDLDDKIQITLPSGVTAAQVTAQLDDPRQVLMLAIDGVPRKVYPLGGPATLMIGPTSSTSPQITYMLALRPGDRAELAPLVTIERASTWSQWGDRDYDGIPNALDLLIGAKKTVLNADAYTTEAQGYIQIAYPKGDVPRTIGVCTDVVIRAARNAGIDLQRELHEDIRRAPNEYPMVKGRGDPNIDHRRVGTLLPYFLRHWERHTPRLDDPDDPLHPGDIILMDTFPSRPGPDHIGILSDRLDDGGLPLVINNWTNGTVTKEMDLLRSVPVVYRFRLRS